MLLPADIVIKIRQDFSEDEALLVLQLFKALSRDESDVFNERVLRCLIVLAQGDLNTLGKTIDQARNDWRDVIMAAEYERGSHVRHLQFSFGFHPDIATFKQWLVGRKILVPWLENQVWTIAFPDIREFSLMQTDRLKNAAAKDIFFARVDFLLIEGNREISASRALAGTVVFNYRFDTQTGRFELQKMGCVFEGFHKRGQW